MLSQILEAMKLSEDVPHWKITEKVLVHCNTASKDYQQVPESCIH